jgi:hypothetical protein
MAELQQMLLTAAQAYVTAAQRAAAWLNAPTPANQDSAGQGLVQAQQALDLVRQSRWLIAGH